MRLVYIGGGGYRVSDADAGKLARAVGRKLPPRGRSLSVTMPYGEPAILARGQLHSMGPIGGEYFKIPRRGWVWYVSPTTQSFERYTTKPSAPVPRAALAKARQAGRYARELEERAWVGSPPFKGAPILTGVRFDEEGGREAADAHLVAADAFEEAGEMLLAMRHREDAKRLRGLMSSKGRLREFMSGRRDPRSRRTRRRR